MMMTRMVLPVVVLAVCPTAAQAAPTTRPTWLDDRAFVEPRTRGPRPLLYYATSVHYSDPRMFTCGSQIVGGKWWDPAFVLYADGTVIFLRKPASPDGLMQFHSVRLTAGELAEWRRTIGAPAAAQLRPLRSHYDAMPGTLHGVQDQVVSWLEERKTVHVHGMGLQSGVGFVGRRGRVDAIPGLRAPVRPSHHHTLQPPGLTPQALIELRQKLLQFDHGRARRWAPRRLEVRLEPADAESEAQFKKWHSKPPAVIRWLGTWPRLDRAKVLEPDARLPIPTSPKPQLAVTLSRRQLLDLAAQLRTISGCFTQHLVLAGPAGAERHYWLQPPPAFQLPEEQLWQDERSAVPELIRLMQQGDDETRHRATWTLTRAAWRGTELHLRLLRHRSRVVRALTASALGEAVSSAVDNKGLAAALPALTRAMRDDPEELVRIHAAVARIRIGGKALVADALPILSRALTGGEESLRLLAAQELRALGAASGPAAAALQAALGDKRPVVRAMAAQALLRHRPPSLEAQAVAAIAGVLALGPLSKDSEPGQQLRHDLARALGKVKGRARPAALAVLRRALSDEEYQVRGQAAEALAAEPGQARSAIPALLRLLGRDTGYARDAALRILRALKQQPQILAALRAGLRARDADVRYVSADELGQLKQGASVAVGDLIAALSDEKLFVRAASAAALGEIGQASSAVLQALERAGKDREEVVRARAAEALSRLRGPRK